MSNSNRKQSGFQIKYVYWKFLLIRFYSKFPPGSLCTNFIKLSHYLRWNFVAFYDCFKLYLLIMSLTLCHTLQHVAKIHLNSRTNSYGQSDDGYREVSKVIQNRVTSFMNEQLLLFWKIQRKNQEWAQTY